MARQNRMPGRSLLVLSLFTLLTGRTSLAK